jgi:hypothetical protein
MAHGFRGTPDRLMAVLQQLQLVFRDEVQDLGQAILFESPITSDQDRLKPNFDIATTRLHVNVWSFGTV